MRLSQFTDYAKFKPVVRNAWQVAGYRGGGRVGQALPVEFRDGKRLELRGGTQDHSVFREVFGSDVYHVANLAGKTLGDVIDLGGNVGLFSALIAPMAKRVLTFEPMPSNFDRLQKNLAPFQNVTPFNVAVGGEVGTLALYAAEADRATGRFSSQPQPGIHGVTPAVEVPCITLDSVFADNNVTRCALLKIDVEGAEYAVLRGASGATLAAIDDIRGEYHPADDIDDAPATIKRLLEPHGFTVEIERQENEHNYGMFFARRA